MIRHRPARRSWRSSPLLVVLELLRLLLVTFVVVIARAFGGQPRIPDPMRRNQVTQVDRKRHNR